MIKLTSGEKLYFSAVISDFIFVQMVILKKCCFVVGLLTIVCCCNVSSSKEAVKQNIVPAVAVDSGAYSKKVASFMEAELLKRSFNGSILIAKDDKIIYEKYSGLIDLRKKDSVNENTAFHLASTGKTFTAVAILRMAENGQLSLNDSLSKFFPGFPYHGITVRMLLSHRSGLPNYIYFIPNSDWDQTKPVTDKDVLNLLYTEKPPPYFYPDRRFEYSNTNFVLLALIIEKISGMPYPEYMKTNFFEPLHMDHTYVYTPADSSFTISSFNYNNRLWQNDFLELTYGDKNIYSTPRDMFRWSEALFNGKVISEKMLDSAFTPQLGAANQGHKKVLPNVRYYGLGFRLMLTPDGKKIIYHFGRWHGFNSAFARLPDEKVTIIIMGNKFNENIYRSARKAYNLFGNYTPEQGQEDEEIDDANLRAKKHVAKPVKRKTASKVTHKKKPSH